jgi:hypothetical protein
MKWFLFFSFACLALPLEGKEDGAIKARYVPLEIKNKQADRAFIDWLIDSQSYSISDELRKILTPEAREFIVNESQLPLKEYLTKEQFKQKVDQVRNDFEKRFPELSTKSYKRQLDKLIEDVITPEYVFQIDMKESLDPGDVHYNELMKSLSRFSTAEGTSLKDWAFSFLTSESQLIALSILRKETVGGLFFHDLLDYEQMYLLTIAAELITRRFMDNLRAVCQKYHFQEPPQIKVALKKRVNQFLFEKFSS